MPIKSVENIEDKEYMEIQRRKTFKLKEFQNELHVFRMQQLTLPIAAVFTMSGDLTDYQNPGKYYPYQITQ